MPDYLAHVADAFLAKYFPQPSRAVFDSPAHAHQLIYAFLQSDYPEIAITPAVIRRVCWSVGMRAQAPK